MAFDRKAAALLDLKPDLAIICECAEPDRLHARGAGDWLKSDPVWVGENPNKGLGIFAFNGYSATLAEPHFPTLRYIAPVAVSGPVGFNLLAVWAQNASGGVTRKNQSGPLRRALSKYRGFLTERDTIIGGDFNNNAIWDRPGWRINHMTKVKMLDALGLASAYHAVRGEAPGEETEPTLYWRDRTRDGPTYHIDYIFMPVGWLGNIERLEVGSFEQWVGSGFSDHVPLVLDLRF